MFSSARRLYQRARTLGHQLFHRFGVHCATHQIRVILISGVVITSLFYPALAIYSSSQPRFLAHFTFQILDPFLAVDAVDAYYAQHDLVDLWSAHENIHVREDSVALARCGIEHTLRVERIMIHDAHGVLNQNTLLAALELESAVAAALPAARPPCTRLPNGACLALSPLEFWRHDARTLRADDRIRETLTGARNASLEAAPLAPSMVFAGRDGASAQFLVFSYFFPETDCTGNAAHLAWRELLFNATEPYAYPFSSTQEPRVLELEYATDEHRMIPSPLTAFIVLAYLSFGAWVFRSLRTMPPVHNPIGLVFTGVVEVVVSTITSLSVCALVGFRITMLPWSIFPLVIMFIGAETMSNLVIGVVKTSIALPVKERIGEGLSRAGTSNSLKVLTYNVILGIIAFFARGAIRQFCAFAVVVLVAHWFLVHTFFVAVLSIDLQRLELEELLQQNASESLVPKPRTDTRSQRSGGKHGVMGAMKSLLGGRAATNVSLFLLLAITATLYFATAPSGKDEAELLLARDALTHRSKLQSSRHSPAYHTWRLLNPADEPRMHVRIEAPTVLVLRPPGDAGTLQRSPRPARSAARTLTWLFRIVFLPYAVTLTALYALLLYLLKDADRLEAQRTSAEPDRAPDAPLPLDSALSFDTLPRAFGTDVELLAASADGAVIAAVGLDSEAVVWVSATRTLHALPTTALLRRGAVTALAIADDSSALALGTTTGVIALWEINEEGVPCAAPRVAAAPGGSTTTALAFGSPQPMPAAAAAAAAAAAPPGSRPPSPQTTLQLASAFENGTVARWDVHALDAAPHLTTARVSALWVSFVRVAGPARVLALFGRADGVLEARDVFPCAPGAPTLASDCALRVGSADDPPTCVHAAHVERALLLVSATRAGSVSVWDAGTGECVALLDEPLGVVTRLRLCAAPARPCTRCRELGADSFALLAGVGTAVFAYAARAGGRRACACEPGAGWARRGVRRTSESGPGADAAFPVSAHGGLSRRGSEKDLARLMRPPAPDALLLGVTPELADGVQERVRTQAQAARSRWREVDVVRVTEAGCERGAWDVVEDRVVGVRRRARQVHASGNGHERGVVGAVKSRGAERGLSAAVRERWEVWVLDPVRGAGVEFAPICALRTGLEEGEGEGKGEEAPRLPFTRVGPVAGARSVVLAGFGNAVGVFGFGKEGR